MQPPKSIKINSNKGIVTNIQQIGDIPKATLEANPKIVEQIGIEQVMLKNGFLPHGIHIDDLDKGFIDWLKDFSFQTEGEIVEVHLYTLQRYAEFMQNWSNTEQTNTIKLPHISITKSSPAKKGSLLGNTINLPSNDTYAIYKEIKIEGGKEVEYLYEIGQPYTVDLTYKVDFFANHQRDVNEFNELILNTFKKGQVSLNIKEHLMELKLDDISETNKSDLEERRYYHYVFNFTLKGILIDECDFKVKKALNSISMDLSVCEVKNSRACNVTIPKNNKCGCEECYTFAFGRKGPKIIEHKLLQNIQFNYDNQTLTNINKYYINCNEVHLPFIANVGDILKIEYIANIMKPNIIKICGIVL